MKCNGALQFVTGDCIGGQWAGWAYCGCWSSVIGQSYLM